MSTTAVPSLRLALVKAHVLPRQGLAALIHTSTPHRVVLQAHDGEEYERLCRSNTAPRVALVAMNNEVDGLRTIGWIVQSQPGTLPLAYGCGRDDTRVRRALDAGSRGYLCMSCDEQELSAAFEQLHTNGAYASPATAAHKVSWDALQREKQRILALLTPRETDVLRLMCRADAPQNKQIGEELKMDGTTVAQHYSAIATKLRLNGRTAVIIIALRLDLFSDRAQHVM